MISTIAFMIERARKALRRYGFFGMVRESAHLLVSFRTRRTFARLEREFDQKHGVETAGIVRLFDLDIPSGNKKFGNRYGAAHPDTFRRMLGSLPLPFGDFIFVDYGSGKGRALLLASDFPFKRIIGIEFSPELNRTAEENIARFRSDAQRCGELQSVCTDATEYTLPNEPAVLYFNNPFEEPVMREVLRQIRHSLEEYPREIYVMLMGDSPLAPLIEEAGFVRLEVDRLSGGRGRRDARTGGLFAAGTSALAARG